MLASSFGPPQPIPGSLGARSGGAEKFTFEIDVSWQDDPGAAPLFLAEVPRPLMTDQALLAKVGQTIWGPAWQEPMAVALKLPPSTIAEWIGGRSVVPADSWKALREVARLHHLKLADLDPQIVSAYDAAVARASARR